MTDAPTENLVRERSAPDAAQLRTSEDGNTLHGHFSVFNEWTEIVSTYEGRFMERVAPGAFDKPFENRESIRVLYDHGHDPSIGNKPLGVPTVLEQDGRGARYEVPLFDATYVNDLKPALRANALGASFRFSIEADDWRNPQKSSDYNPDRLPERTIESVNLYEFGPVTFPAYAGATAGIRSGTDRFHERMMNDPLFVARFVERVGPRIVEQLLAQVSADGHARALPLSSADGQRAGLLEGTDPRAVLTLAAGLRARG